MGSFLRCAATLSMIGGLVLHIDMSDSVCHPCWQGYQVVACMPRDTSGLTYFGTGLFLGENLPTIPSKLAEHIRKWEFAEIFKFLC